VSRFAAPLMCRTEAGFGWRILLRRGNCDCRREVLASDEQALRVERDVAGDIVAMRRALERLDRIASPPRSTRSSPP
jgi:hypothetical protein